ncbi:transposase [Fimbriiglobus ruber]|uniref:Transposase IS701-like DDE domain-containing protein n=1 Tax=Fimbriiglobus ruber TaxID=1908690 RepID=A0A225DRJ8_9BACT|nr:transposase [Fimbriiglobus ruber]OWK41238.1 hypothetical protein FRUB_04601 [Fimbriiglobus ruber]
MSSSHTTPPPCHWFSRLGGALDCRSGARLARLFVGAVVARGRRTVTGWIRAAGLSDQFRSCDTTVAAVGRRTDACATRLMNAVVKPLVAADESLTLALDDTPTERYGPQVPGAGVHHNPTPGPAGSAYVYGHVWVVLGLLVTHPTWGITALPLLARLYVRAKDVAGIPAVDRPVFRTKHAMGVELVRWAVGCLGEWGKVLWVVADGAYATAPFLKPVIALGVRVVSRLRSDAALWTEPGPRRPGQRGRRRIYGDRRMSLAKRAAQKGGWSTGTFVLYGKPTTKRYKTFVATWRPAGGAIRVVVVDEPTGWRAYFCTDPSATVADILTRVAGRFALETTFRDLKQVVGAGHQQVRRFAANVGAFHVCLWTFVMTEAWASTATPEALVGHRATAPWDDAARRPSHADKRRGWQREWQGKEIRAALRPGMTEAEIQAAAERLLDLAA